MGPDNDGVRTGKRDPRNTNVWSVKTPVFLPFVDQNSPNNRAYLAVADPAMGGPGDRPPPH